MKINITNIYGMSGQSTALIAQNETVKIAKKLDFHELSFYFYNIYSDSEGELNSRLDGVLAKLGYGDIVVYQSPTWNGREYDQAFIRKCKILNTRIITFIHDVPPLMFPSNYYLMSEYIEMYNQSDLVVVPSEKMKERLIQEGLTVQKIIIQGMWDHVHNYPLKQPSFQKNYLLRVVWNALDIYPTGVIQLLSIFFQNLITKIVIQEFPLKVGKQIQSCFLLYQRVVLA
ncbi:Glycosyl transferase [Streptococcus pneumoniae]|nr:Glycosyl transferase [Streptococcus pneumoniae]CWA21984.1 Glycosyl transferase [Streptococcus pneumoniae]